MRNLKRNNRSFTYELYLGKVAIVDSEGFETGESAPTYADPIEMSANVSPATGTAQIEAFGSLDSYDHVIITHDIDCPINEETVIRYDGKRYVVRRVAKSLNSIAYAISEAETSE